MESMMIYVPIVMALLGLAFMAAKRAWVLKQDAGDGKMKEISDYIYEGALAFLKAEYRLLAIFVLIASVVLAGITFIPGVKTHLLIVVAFIFGAIFSALAGNMGMKIATKTNVRTTQAARTSLPQALKVSFGGGTVMGLGVAGLAVLGLTGFFILFFHMFMDGVWTDTDGMTVVLETLAGFSLGAESIALFARVGGGIYTKAADVGADLVGKVEAGIPEDDPRNPRFEARYNEVPDAELPRTESLKDTIDRIMPYWQCVIFPNLKKVDEVKAFLTKVSGPNDDPAKAESSLIDREQSVLIAIIPKMKSANTLLKYKKFVTAFGDNIKTDFVFGNIKALGVNYNGVLGNITKENIEKLTGLGVDYISSGALTHSAPILDISLKGLHAI